jgi:enoyl-CoA hydratase
MAVHYEIDDAIATVTIDRPDVANAVDRETAAQLYEAFQAFDADETLAVAILTGANGTFCAGGDLKAMLDGRGIVVTPEGPGPMGPTRMMLSKPVIAAVEGHAVAGGLELALWCDLRAAARDATFGVYCRRWGVPLCDGGTVRLPRLVGHSHALDMILTGRGVGAEEAATMGLVNRVCDPGTALATATTLARALARLPQTCLRSDRRSSYEQYQMDIDAALLHETRLGLEVIRSGETISGIQGWRSGATKASDFPNV